MKYAGCGLGLRATEWDGHEKTMNKIEQFKATKQAERKMHAAKMDYHMRRITGAHETSDQRRVDCHELAIQKCELKLHQLKKFI
jgi:hypothetical protein